MVVPPPSKAEFLVTLNGSRYRVWATSKRQATKMARAAHVKSNPVPRYSREVTLMEKGRLSEKITVYGNTPEELVAKLRKRARSDPRIRVALGMA